MPFRNCEAEGCKKYISVDSTIPYCSEHYSCSLSREHLVKRGLALNENKMEEVVPDLPPPMDPGKNPARKSTWNPPPVYDLSVLTPRTPIRRHDALASFQQEVVQCPFPDCIEYVHRWSLNIFCTHHRHHLEEVHWKHAPVSPVRIPSQPVIEALWKVLDWDAEGSIERDVLQKILAPHFPKVEWENFPSYITEYEFKELFQDINHVLVCSSINAISLRQLWEMMNREHTQKIPIRAMKQLVHYNHIKDPPKFTDPRYDGTVDFMQFVQWINKLPAATQLHLMALCTFLLERPLNPNESVWNISSGVVNVKDIINPLWRICGGEDELSLYDLRQKMLYPPFAVDWDILPETLTSETFPYVFALANTIEINASMMDSLAIDRLWKIAVPAGETITKQQAIEFINCTEIKVWLQGNLSTFSDFVKWICGMPEDQQQRLAAISLCLKQENWEEVEVFET